MKKKDIPHPLRNIKSIDETIARAMWFYKELERRNNNPNINYTHKKEQVVKQKIEQENKVVITDLNKKKRIEFSKTTRHFSYF